MWSAVGMTRSLGRDGSVVGGDDCNDTSDFTYPGAAVNSPSVCALDSTMMEILIV